MKEIVLKHKMTGVKTTSFELRLQNDCKFVRRSSLWKGFYLRLLHIQNSSNLYMQLVFLISILSKEQVREIFIIYFYIYLTFTCIV